MRIFSTEQVSKYHPDKYADQISDAILTEYLKQDRNSHCAIETLVKGDAVVIAGEISSKAIVSHKEVIQRVADKLGYKVVEIIDYISKQSPEINNAVLSSDDFGAGDQGMMFGFATNETEDLLPLGFYYANKIIEKIENDVENNSDTILKGDAKTQVSIDLDTNEVKEVLVSVCHKDTCKDIGEVREYVHNLVKDVVPNAEKWTINPSGLWTIGGAEADCGLTGRKIVCDQYGGYCAVGGGAFSGKDPTKVDRSASYMARVIACDLLREFGLSWCQVQLAYEIGVSHPSSVYVNNDKRLDLADYIKCNYNLTPKGIIEYLRLYDVDYEKLAEGCHYRQVKGGIYREKI